MVASWHFPVLSGARQDLTSHLLPALDQLSADSLPPCAPAGIGGVAFLQRAAYPGGDVDSPLCLIPRLAATLAQVAVSTSGFMARVHEQVYDEAQAFGLSIVDARIRRAHLPEPVAPVQRPR
jgi:hypothetical protein